MNGAGRSRYKQASCRAGKVCCKNRPSHRVVAIMHFCHSLPPVVFALLLSSCAALVNEPRVARRVPFNEAAFAEYRGAGSSAVAGQLIVKGPDGETHIGGGTEISLLPVTAYTKEHFVFDHVRAGEYFVNAQVEWSFADDTSYQWACERISVGAGQTVRVKVSKDLHHPNMRGLVISALR